MIKQQKKKLYDMHAKISGVIILFNGNKSLLQTSHHFPPH